MKKLPQAVYHNRAADQFEAGAPARQYLCTECTETIAGREVTDSGHLLDCENCGAWLGGYFVGGLPDAPRIETEADYRRGLVLHELRRANHLRWGNGMIPISYKPALWALGERFPARLDYLERVIIAYTAADRPTDILLHEAIAIEEDSEAPERGRGLWLSCTSSVLRAVGANGTGVLFNPEKSSAYRKGYDVVSVNDALRIFRMHDEIYQVKLQLLIPDFSVVPYERVDHEFLESGIYQPVSAPK